MIVCVQSSGLKESWPFSSSISFLTRVPMVWAPKMPHILRRPAPFLEGPPFQNADSALFRFLWLNLASKTYCLNALFSIGIGWKNIIIMKSFVLSTFIIQIYDLTILSHLKDNRWPDFRTFNMILFVFFRRRRSLQGSREGVELATKVYQRL